MKEEPDKKLKRAPTASFMTGVVALVFLAIGYQTALFIHTAAVEHIISDRDHPDTVFIYESPSAAAYEAGYGSGGGAGDAAGYGSGDGAGGASGYGAGGRSGHAAGGGVGDASGGGAGSRGSIGPDTSGGGGAGSRGSIGLGGSIGSASSAGGERQGRTVVRKNAGHSEGAMAVRAANPPREARPFPFNPNSASLDDFVRLGFSQKQAASIINYRKKGGKFRRKSDFAKSYVVSDEMFARLEPYIRIPKVDLNTADSTALDALPGIGPYFVKKIIEHRKALKGYSFPEQLMDIYHFDEEKFNGLRDLVTVSPPAPYPIWTLPADSLRLHPYIGRYSADAIVLFRQHNPKEKWTVNELAAAGLLQPEVIPKLQRCHLAEP